MDDNDKNALGVYFKVLENLDVHLLEYNNLKGDKIKIPYKFIDLLKR